MLLLLIASAFAWDTVGATWPEMPVHYQIAADLGFDDEDAVDAIHAAFATWSSVECSSVAFVEDDRSTTGAWGDADGHNVVFVLDGGWPSEPALLTAPSITTDGTALAEVDIAVNAEDHPWATDGDGIVVFDLQAGLTHEIGHLLGLWHSTVADATMNPVLDGNPDARTLEADDIEGLCALYPAHTGDGDQGDSCETSDDCAIDLACLADGPERYCARSCDDGQTCSDGFECLDVEGGALCAREAGCGCQTAPGIGAVPAFLALLLTSSRRRRPR